MSTFQDLLKNRTTALKTAADTLKGTIKKSTSVLIDCLKEKINNSTITLIEAFFEKE